jgi:hypothetical protein
VLFCRAVDPILEDASDTGNPAKVTVNTTGLPPACGCLFIGDNSKPRVLWRHHDVDNVVYTHDEKSKPSMDITTYELTAQGSVPASLFAGV